MNNLQVAELTKKEKRLLRKQGIIDNKNRFQTNNLNIKPIFPLTANQELAFKAYEEGNNLLLHGMAGTGKTFISLYLALNDVLKNGKQEEIHIVRSVVPTRDMGFLPGNHKEKSRVYEGPYYPIVNNLFSRGDAYDILKQKGIINFTTTSFIRGITINDAIVIVDEMNNCTFHELDSVITRLGKNCKVIFCGDFRQTDLQKQSDKNGLLSFMEIVDKMKRFQYVEFGEDDIVRSGLVRDYIIQKTNLGYT